MQNCVKCGRHLLCRPKENAGFGRSCSHSWSTALKLFQLLRKEKIFSYLPNSKLRLWRNAPVFIVTRSVTNNRLYGNEIIGTTTQNERSTSNPIFTVHTLYTGFTTITICFNISVYWKGFERSCRIQFLRLFPSKDVAWPSATVNSSIYLLQISSY